MTWHWSSRGLVGFMFNWHSEDQCQRTHWKCLVFFLIPHLKKQIQPLNPLRTVSKVSNCPWWSPWLLIVLVHSLRSMRLDIAWLVKSRTYFDLNGWIGGCGHGFQHSKYKFSSHPKTLELICKCDILYNAVQFFTILHTALGWQWQNGD